MTYLVIKYGVTALIVVLASEFAKTHDKLGSLVAAMPLVTVLTLIWLYIEKVPTSKIADQAFYTFWYVIPTLPMFLVFAYGLPKWGFWPTLLGCIVMTAAMFVVYAAVLDRFGLHLR
jgi:hypothetical protein